MAEGNNENISSDHSKKCQNSGTADDSEDEDAMIPDLGVENIRSVSKKANQNVENHSSCSG